MTTTPKTLHVFGAELTDVIFEIVTAEGPVIWNVSKIQRAADAGKFGPPVEFAMECTTAPNYADGNLDKAKIERMKLLPDVLAKPALAIAAPVPGHIFCFCDGQHRISALYELQRPTFSTFIVPNAIEKNFRITYREEP